MFSRILDLVRADPGNSDRHPASSPPQTIENAPEASASRGRDLANEMKRASVTDSAFVIEELTRIDFLKQLPFELSLHILSQLNDVKTLAKASQVSRLWYSLANDRDIWRRFYLNQWRGRWTLPAVRPEYCPAISAINTPRQSIDQISGRPQPHGEHPGSVSGSARSLESGPETRLQSLNNSTHSVQSISNGQQSDPAEPHPPPKPRDWKYLHRQRLLLETNWRTGKIRQKKLEGHSDSVYCIQFDRNYIISGSRDRTVRFWDIKKAKCVRTLHGHDGSVLCLQYDSRYIVTGSSDHSIIIWEFPTGKLLKRLSGHTLPVLDVRFNSEVIVSCSKDHLIKVWDLHTGALLRVLEGHVAAVNAIHLFGNLLASASGDAIVKLWDVNTGKLLRDFREHARGLACVHFDGRYIASGSNDKSIKIWNAHTGQLIRTLSKHTDLVRTLCFDQDRIVSGSYDQSIKVWDFKTGHILVDLKDVHSSWVFHVQMDNTKIVSASQDKSICILDFTEGVDAIDELEQVALEECELMQRVHEHDYQVLSSGGATV
ncbi:WD40-repeat-containing domain protein [Polychytrium aggregatum]|uniref:WD40-repeat-containing domain protein n=1 Tax=Polychytrium aggregatum TaxID=110093 RepID=UPI0022FE76BD|nr:WD40-repeat-containing domain protein [Polychytrium aggregatum]KAI9199557.1 WD40-repeat-containing domain protein [Polychytrium aggregatum]